MSLPCKPCRANQGFTLIELMIVTVIVAVLAAVALPSFSNQLAKGRRAAAQAHLMDIAQRQHQYLLDTRAYASTVTALNLTTPTDVASFYTISVADIAATPPTFTVTAEPKAGTAQASDGTLTINHAGRKTPAGKW